MKKHLKRTSEPTQPKTVKEEALKSTTGGVVANASSGSKTTDVKVEGDA